MTTTDAQPIRILPRLDAKPWGGRRLASWGITLPPGETIGEALLTAPEATVATGPDEGVTLGELASRDPTAWVGANGLAVTGNRPVFPLLIKLIDSHHDLSIQVHPDDAAAAAAGLGTGKTEAYHILSAAPESIIYLGLLPNTNMAAFAAACRRADGSAAGFLRQVAARPGMTVLIPAGAPHALGAGVTLYEIQQPSNVTFRLDDWGRLDAAGRPRPLHHDAGLAALDGRSRPETIAPVTISGTGGQRQLLVATRYFALERIASGAPPQHLTAVASPQALTCIEGDWTLATASSSLPLTRGETVILPAETAASLRSSNDGMALRGWVPDIERDIAVPARAAGASATQIQALAGAAYQDH